MHRVLLIDDDLSLSDLLSEYLEQQNFTVEVANLAERGIEKLKSTQFDLLLLDVMMPVMDGFQALAEIRKFSKVPVIMLTAKGDDYDKILGLELGADDYLTKPFNHRELLARMKALIRRLSPEGILNSDNKLKAHGIEVHVGSQEVKIGEELVEMTATEFILLSELIKNKGQLLSKNDLNLKVLGRRMTAYDRSLDMHVSNLRKKLQSHGIENAIKTVRGNGYLMKSDEL